MGIESIIKKNVPESDLSRLDQTIGNITAKRSVRDLYMAYSLLNKNFDRDKKVVCSDIDEDLGAYLVQHRANLLDLARIHLLSGVLRKDHDFFVDKVANIIQVADTSELATFLRYMILLPNAGDFKQTAVEALRTNIAVLFDAIALNNPYPGKFFNDRQWNQMYLKAAFMERDLSQIQDVDLRANRELSRIISDYAHERWAASRKVDPLFWRPVAPFLDQALLEDMQRLLESDDVEENKAGALCCHHSNNERAMALLQGYPALLEAIQRKELTWNTVKTM
ncbi:EboA domain-containing protein [Maribacter sp. 2307ULW6-5]|uniref:EboA domain-containing protein n=1 Tax=Maribacter sp. 2307ULW6-5 TaxID=3386275 RepID=UPI0039BC9C9A